MSATLAEMFPGRFWFAAGSGQALNEHVTGDRWPSKAEREERLLESIQVIRALHAGETVSHEGRVRVDRAVLWTRPETPPPIFGAAVTPRTAAWVATWADGLITINQPPDTLREVLEAFRSGGGEGPVRLQVHVSYAEDGAASLELAHRQWAAAMIGSELAWNIATPAEFEQVARFVRPDDVRDAVLVGGGTGALVDQVGALLDVGAGYGLDELYLHHVGQEQDAWLDAAGSTLLPALRAHSG
jgi:G6PDH family F420-dependent oxidoreductase